MSDQPRAGEGGRKRWAGPWKLNGNRWVRPFWNEQHTAMRWHSQLSGNGWSVSPGPDGFMVTVTQQWEVGPRA